MKEKYVADENAGRDYTCSAEGASNYYESLRQKNSYWTQLWRVLFQQKAANGEISC